MSQLVPCSVCHRHARIRDGACPFCGGALSGESRRAIEVPVGAKRAVIFALSMSAAAPACDAFEREQASTQPLYGGVITLPEPSSEPAPTNPPGGSQTAQPIYGAPVVPSDTVPMPTAAPSALDAGVDANDVDSGDSGTSDAGADPADAGSSDTVHPEPSGTEPLPIPLYGGPPLR